MTFQWPYLLFGLILVPLLLLVYILMQRRRRAYAVRFTNLALLSTVVAKRPGIRRHIPAALFLVGITALLISLARPMAVIAVPRDQASIMIVMDVSGSMAANDLQPSRIEAAKQAARAFVNNLPSDIQVGLVSFNSVANLNAPLTRDRTALLRAIDTLRPNGGTAIGVGLNTALDQLDEQVGSGTNQRPPSLVVLLSDGQSTDGIPPEEAAYRAQTEQIKVYTVGIGQRGANPRINGVRTATSLQLDETTLQNIAGQTGGQYFYAAESKELEQIYSKLSSQISWVEERTEVTAIVSALGAMFLIVGGGLSLLWFQRLP